jgi:NAD(P)-dependent dehydrogenase (short-subunit alcohol dehydrogenase family)
VGRLAGWRVLVVGASAGIGRAIAAALAAEGAQVAAAARRADRLAELGRETGALPVPCDVRDPASCTAAVADSAARLGGLDVLVYAAGAAPLAAIADADAGAWGRALETNLVGAALVTRAALPHLARGRARAVYLSSIAAHERPPRCGLGTYIASKRALDSLVEVLREEHPDVAFTRISIGDTGATEMAAGWDPTVGAARVREWVAQGYITGRLLRPEGVARHVVDLLAGEPAVTVSVLDARRGPASGAR